MTRVVGEVEKVASVTGLRGSRAGRGWLAVGLSAAMFVLQGCIPFPPPGKPHDESFDVRNYRSTKVIVEMSELTLDVPPGSDRGTSIPGCRDTGAVAKDAEGKIARLAEVCAGVTSGSSTGMGLSRTFRIRNSRPDLCHHNARLAEAAGLLPKFAARGRRRVGRGSGSWLGHLVRTRSPNERRPTHAVTIAWRRKLEAVVPVGETHDRFQRRAQVAADETGGAFRVGMEHRSLLTVVPGRGRTRRRRRRWRSSPVALWIPGT